MAEVEFSQDDIMRAIAEAAAQRLGRPAAFSVRLVVKSRGDEVTITATAREV